MNIESIAELIEGRIVTQVKCDGAIHWALSSDLMSDVLTLEVENAILITGLSNLQTIRTAEMSDINYILLARNKKASAEMIQLANKAHITLLESPYGVFRVSGILYSQGIKPIY